MYLPPSASAPIGTCIITSFSARANSASDNTNNSSYSRLFRFPLGIAGRGGKATTSTYIQRLVLSFFRIFHWRIVQHGFVRRRAVALYDR